MRAVRLAAVLNDSNLQPFFPFLFHVEDLRVSSTQSQKGEDGISSEQWLELIRAFGGTKVFRVAGVHVTDILCALRPADGVHTADTTVLPALRKLHIQEPMPIGPLRDAARPFITSRLLSGRPVELHAVHKTFSCPLLDCGRLFKSLEIFKRHLRTHFMGLPFQCSVCLKRFSRHDTLVDHTRSHAPSGDPGVATFGQGTYGFEIATEVLDRLDSDSDLVAYALTRLLEVEVLGDFPEDDLLPSAAASVRSS